MHDAHKNEELYALNHLYEAFIILVVNFSFLQNQPGSVSPCYPYD